MKRSTQALISSAILGIAGFVFLFIDPMVAAVLILLADSAYTRSEVLEMKEMLNER